MLPLLFSAPAAPPPPAAPVYETVMMVTPQGRLRMIRRLAQ
jgi:hypothetical protein